MVQTQQYNMSCDILSSTGLQGKLNSDNGLFRDIVLGALNFRNSYGAIYTVESGRTLVNPNSGFSRRQANGHAKGEYGHPKRIGQMTDEQWMERIMTIEETRVSHDHIKTWIDTITDRKTGNKVIAFLGDIQAAGPYGPTLERDLLRPNSNVSFSIRSITEDFEIAGLHNKNIIDASGWDTVVEPGLSVAHKFNSPSLESVRFTKENLEEIVNKANSDTISMEATNLLKGFITSIENASSVTKVYMPPRASRLIGS